MTDLPTLVLWGLVICIGLPSMLKNWTATVLVASWLIGVLYTKETGVGIPLEGDILRDLMVLVVIFTTKGQLSREDWTIVALFAPMWFAYAVRMHPDLSYQILWSAAVLQFLACGIEALDHWRRGRARVGVTNSTDPPLSRQGLRYEW